MLWTIFVVLLVLWLLGFSLHIGGALIHLLLVVGLVVLVINLLSGRRSAVQRRAVESRHGGPGVSPPIPTSWWPMNRHGVGKIDQLGTT